MARESFELFHGRPSPTSLSFPPLYGEVEEEMRSRRVCVSPEISMCDFKQLVHDLYCEEYALSFSPSSLRLYTRFDVDVVEIQSDKRFHKAITHQEDCLGGFVGKTSEICVIVSRHLDDTLNHLLILPAIFPVTYEILEKHTQHTLLSPSQKEQLSLLCSPLGGPLFPPLPLPCHIDDWVAQYRDTPQSVGRFAGSWCERERNKNQRIGKQVIHILPIAAPSLSSLDPSIFGEKKSTLFPKKLLDDLSCLVSAFFDSPVEVLPVLELKPKQGKSKKQRLVSPKGVDVEYRYKVPESGQIQKQGQLSCPDLLECVVAQRESECALCVLGVTLADAFCGVDDTFTVGLASIDIGVFSFYRYLTGFSSSSASSSRYQTLLGRAAKTAVHEICHMFGVAHCVHRSCCMNGSGHILEDFSIPMGVCPVCLAKIACFLGENFSFSERSSKLLSAYDSVGLTEEKKHEKAVLALLKGEYKEENGQKKRKRGEEEQKEAAETRKGRKRGKKEEENKENGYEKKTVVQLRAECKRRGLLVGGRKKELILRLTE